MDRARIEEEGDKFGIPETWDSVMAFAEHIAKLAREEALEQVITELSDIHDKYGSLSLGVSFMRIRALKEQK
jgi:hypothetical protein